MIEMHSWMTSNSRKIYYMLEETGLEFRIHPVNIGAKEQFEPAFLEISPNNKTPALIDLDGPGGQPLAVFETGAMLIYLSEKSGQFMPDDPSDRSAVLQWMFWQVGGMSPMFGQAGHFRGLEDQDANAYAAERFSNEVVRLYGVLEKRLSKNEYVAGDSYTIADMAVQPWTRMPSRQGADIDDYPNCKRWRDQIAERAAVQRANQIADSVREAAASADGPIDPASLV